MELFLSKPAVFGLAVLGAALATAASVLQRRGWLSARGALLLNAAGYVAMGASMLLFALAGLRGAAGGAS